MRLLLCYITAILVINDSQAQDTEKPVKERWLLNISMSGGYDVKSAKMGFVTDPLLGYDSHPLSVQLSSTYFFSNNFGICFTIIDNLPYRNSKRDKSFKNSLDARFESDYYVSADTDYFSEQKYETDFVSYKVLGGISYRIKTKKILLMPQIAIGSTTSYSGVGHAHLKEKGSNQRYSLTYVDDEGGKGNFTFAPAINLAYRISNKILVNTAFQYFCSNPEITFTETKTNLYSGLTEQTLIIYDKPYHTIEGSLGIILAIL